MPIDFSKMSDQELIELYKREKGISANVKTQGQTAQSNQVDIPTLLRQAQPSGGQSIANALSVLGGGKPVYDQGGDYAKLYAQEAIKKQFLTEEEKLINRAKAIEAAKSTGNRQLFESLGGGQVKPEVEGFPSVVEPVDQQRPSANASDISQIIAPEIDPFTGKLSSTGERQKTKNELVQQANIIAMKSKMPTANQRDQLAKMNNVEVLINDLEKLSDEIPSGFSGLLSQGEAFLTRGATQTNTVVYNDLRKAVAVSLYRALTGDTRLSDADAASRALPLLWKPDESQEVKKAKFSRVKQLLAQAKQSNVQNQGGSQEFETDAEEGTEMIDSQGNRAIVYPDGRIEEL